MGAKADTTLGAEQDPRLWLLSRGLTCSAEMTFMSWTFRGDSS